MWLSTNPTIPSQVSYLRILQYLKETYTNTSLSIQILNDHIYRNRVEILHTDSMYPSLGPSDTYICVGKLIIIGSDIGLSPRRRQAIIWTNTGILLIGPLRTAFSEILIGIQTFSLKKMPLKMSSVKWRPFCLGLNVLSVFKRISSNDDVWVYQVYICMSSAGHDQDYLFRIQWVKTLRPRQNGPYCYVDLT